MNSCILTLFILCTMSIHSWAQPENNPPHNADDILVTTADSLITNFQYEEALNFLAHGDSTSIDILLRIGKCRYSLGASASAIEPYERVLGFDPDNIVAMNYLGLLYSRSGDYARALSYFSQLISLNPANSYYYKEAGNMASRLGDLIAARLWYRKAFDLNSKDMEAALGLANIEMKLEAYESVDSVVQRALAVDPQFKPLLLLAAKSAYELHYYESTIFYVNKLLQQSDTTALYATLLGKSYFHLEEYVKVVNFMTFLLRNRHDYDWVYYYLGVATRELGDAASSVTWLRLAVEQSISENTSIYYSQMGQSYEDNGDYQGAIRAYRAAYDYSKDGILLYHLARTYDTYYKDKSTAAAYYRKYLESDDTIRRAKEYARQRMIDMGHF